MIRKSTGFTRATVTSLSQMATLQSYLKGFTTHLWAVSFARRSGYRELLCRCSVSLIEFAQQLVLQMSSRGLFDCATFGCYPLLLRLALSPCSRFQRLRHMPDFGPTRADLSLFWFRVRIHQNLALEFVIKNNRKHCVPCNNFIERRCVLNK